MPNQPLTDAEWAAIRQKIVEIARKADLNAKVYPPKKSPSLPRNEQEQERKAS